MNIKEALFEGISLLRKACPDNAETDARVLLCRLLCKDTVFVYTHPDYELHEIEQKKYFSMIKKKAEGMPLNYLTNLREFMSLDFRVNEDVLIPRHETEFLVEEVIKYCKDIEIPSILEIGTGSGCIAVSLAYYMESARITAADISQKALRTASVNALSNKVSNRIKFIRSDIFKNVPLDKYDVIVSNPPYIPTPDIASLDRQVKDYEPLIALDGGEDGLYFYTQIIKFSKNYLKPRGLIVFEVGINQSGRVSQLMRSNSFKTNVLKDLQGIERIVAGRIIG